jgi:hypothetical protein
MHRHAAPPPTPPLTQRLWRSRPGGNRLKKALLFSQQKKQKTLAPGGCDTSRATAANSQKFFVFFQKRSAF